jgi:hypothetical protein
MTRTRFVNLLSPGDLVGNYSAKFVSYSKTEKGKRFAFFICGFCSTKFEACISDVKKTTGGTKSCGCRRSTRNRLSIKHKQLYHAWYNMLARCENPAHPYYCNYGGKGVEVSSRWKGELGLENFIQDMSTTFWPGAILDKDTRFRGNLIYSRITCVWATSKKNQSERVDTRLCELDGSVMTLQEASLLLGLEYRSRVKKWASKGVPKIYQDRIKILERKTND